MSGRDGEIFAFDSAESIQTPINNQNSSSIETINFNNEEGENEEDGSSYFTAMNYQTVRRIEQAKAMLRNHSLLAYQSLQTGEPICLIKAKLKIRLSPNWTPELEEDTFSVSADPPSRDYTIVTPSHTFIEIDNIPHNGSFVSSYGTVGSYKTATFSPGSFKTSDRVKNYKN